MAFHLATGVLSALALLSTTVSADLACKQYIPRGPVKSNSGVITYSGSQGNLNVPSTNLLAGNPSILSSKSPSGSKFKFQTCNSKSLGYSAYSDDGENYDAGCPVYYIDYIRVINPTSGNCLTSKPVPNSNLNTLVFKKCDPDPTTTAQLFMANQQVLYACYDDGKNVYFDTGFYFIDANGPDSDQDPFPDWALAADNKTVQYYTANGTASNLVATIHVG